MQQIAVIATALATLATLGASGPEATGEVPPQTAAAQAAHCGLFRAKQRLQRAEVTFSQAAALARSGRGTQRAMDDARANLTAAQLMWDRAQFALTEAEAAFGPLPSTRPTRCQAAKPRRAPE
ncbi:MAG: hypothetical protein AAFQ19_10455 [Pseudomonadota bacterium]